MIGEQRYQARLWVASNLSTRMAPRRIHPKDVSIKLTENCQARCVTCDYWKHRWSDRINTGQAVHLLGRLSDIGVTTIRFTGGEPLLRRDLFEVVGRADTSKFSTIVLQTNGLLLSRFASQVNDSPFSHITVSLDAVGERNDQIRGIRGYFDRALEGLRRVEGKTRIIAMTLNQLGAGDLNKLIVSTLASRLGEQFTRYELDYIRDYLRPGNPTVRASNPPCILGCTTVYIASDGAVRSGCYVLPPIGNIMEQDIETILGSQEYRDRAVSMLRLECPGCACNVFKSLRTKNAAQDRLRSVQQRISAIAEG